MKELTLINENGKLYADSREIAEMIGKLHKHLLRSINNYVEILTSSKLDSLDFFIKASYVDSKGETRPCYKLTRKGCDMVANKLTGEKGVLFTAEYVTKFEQMEKQIKMQSILPNFNDPVAMARAWADEVEQKQKALAQLSKATQELEDAKPKISYYDTILNSKGTMSITQIGADYGLSAIKLNQILRDWRLIRKVGGQYILYAEFQNQGLTDSKTVNVEQNGEIRAYVQTKWTQKGRLKIHEILTSLGYVANYDKTQVELMFA